jgi:proline racemase
VANPLISLRGNVARMVVACAVSLRAVAVDSLYLNHSTISHLRNIGLSMIRARFFAPFQNVRNCISCSLS